MLRPCTLLGVALAAGLIGSAAAAEDWARQRQALVRVVAADVRATRDYTGRAALDPRVLAALATVPRHLFVPPGERARAYLNRPLPIGYGQTISQPYIVALMSDLAAVVSGSRVLEIGTGSGYQAAMLAELGAEVYSIEIVPELGARAAARLARLGYRGVRTRVGDGYYGWAEAAPFDAIVVSAAASHVPPPLIAQLRRGGRMVIPVGGPFLVQELVLVHKDARGTVSSEALLPVRFVPLTGGH